MSKPDLLLLHGALGARAQFASLLPLLQAQFNVHTLDFEGHGGAALPERPFRIPHFAENVLACMEAHKLNTADIFGHSMGGYVGLYLALRQPEQVRRVFTLGTKFAWTPEFAANEIRKLDAEKMLAKVPRFAATLAERHALPGWRNVLQKTAEMMADLGENPPLSPENVAQIQHVVRIGLGDKDFMSSIEESAAIYRALPNGQLQILPATPHPLEQLSMPDLAQAIRRFFCE